jgi:hypothetical protein
MRRISGKRAYLTRRSQHPDYAARISEGALSSLYVGAGLPITMDS